MGASDIHAVPIIVFTSVLTIFIFAILSIIPGHTQQALTDQCINDSSLSHCGNGINSIITFSNIKDNFSELWPWSLLIFAPILIALIYCGVALATPSWF